MCASQQRFDYGYASEHDIKSLEKIYEGVSEYNYLTNYLTKIMYTSVPFTKNYSMLW
jgi:hypothetical protein